MIAFGMISSIIIARALGPEGKGVFTIFVAIVTIALQFGNFGFHEFNIYITAKRKDLINSIVSNSFFLGISIGICVASIVFFILFFFHGSLFRSTSSPLMYYMVVTIPLLFSILLFQNILLGSGRIFMYNVLQFLNQGIFVFGCIILLFSRSLSLKNLVFLYILTTCISFISAIFSIYKNLELRIDKKLIFQGLNFGIKSYSVSILSYFIIRSDIFFINYFKGPVEVGYYSIAVNITDIVYLIPSIVGLLLFPRIAANESLNKIMVSFKMIALFVFPLTLGLAVMGRWIINFLYGTQFLPSYNVLIILLPAIVFYSLSNVFFSYFSGKSYPSFIIILWIIGFVVNSILNIILIPQYGMIGAALSSLVSYGIIFLLHIISFHIYTKISLSKLFSFSYEEKKILNNFLKFKKI